MADLSDTPTAQRWLPSTTVDEREQYAVAQLPAMRTRTIEVVRGAFDLPEPTIGSQLYGDDQCTPYDHKSFQVGFLIGSSADHLRALEVILASKDGLPPFAWYVLVRSAIETSSLAIWLMNGGVRAKRVFRSLQLTWNDRQNVDTFTKRMGFHTPETTDALWKRLSQIKDSVKGGTQYRLDRAFPSITDIVIEADRVVKLRDGFAGIDAWRACSGFAHGNRSFALATLDHQRTGRTRTPTSAEYELTSNFAMLYALLRVAVTFLERAIDEQGKQAASASRTASR
ncbi:hypothetical protein GCM10028798_19690 [Humibacter antri]